MTLNNAINTTLLSQCLKNWNSRKTKHLTVLLCSIRNRSMMFPPNVVWCYTYVFLFQPLFRILT